MKFGMGQSVARKEDPRLVTGAGQFTADVNFANQGHLAVLRSPVAHGELRTVDVSGARTAPGVLAVLTADDLTELGGLPCRAQLTDADGRPAVLPRRPVLAERRVCFVGQAFAAVVADTLQHARDALERIAFDIEELPANVEPGAAEDSPSLHADAPGNLCVHWQSGDGDAVDAALTGAAHVVRLDLRNNRVVPSPLEPRACVGLFEDDRYILYNPSQGAFAQQGVLARSVLKVPLTQVRVISPDTGGGFGVRGEVHPEAVLCLVAAKQLGRPVKWVGDRSEMFVADSHGRDNLTHAVLGLDARGRILALRVTTIANLGAYCSAVGPFVPTMAGGRIIGTVYKVPVVHHSVRCVFTNTMPVAAYRGAGRPESCYVMERLLETAARELAISPVALRRRNFIAPADLPFTNHMGIDIRSGAFAETMDLALARSGYHDVEARKQSSAAHGRLRGIGIGCYVESSGGGPEEEARLTLRADGGIDVVVGTFSHGQGHRTTYSQLLAEQLGVPFDRINVIQGDTDHVSFGGGTGGSRSSQMGGMAVRGAGAQAVARAMPIAESLLQAQPGTVSFDAGAFRAGNAEVSLARVAAAATEPQFGGAAIQATYRYERQPGYTFPNGCHVAEVELDPDTGQVEVLRYTAVDDCGTVINPLLAAGQVHGGVAQGVGQALLEWAYYDPDSGQPLTGSLLDYAMPRASHLCDIDVAFNEVADPGNPLGVKGIGEGGACGAPPAVVHAVLDALSPLGIRDVQMPMTSHQLWTLMQKRGAR